MIVTFQVQIDPLNDKEFPLEVLQEMEGQMNEFCSALEKHREFLRAQMFVDGKAFNEMTDHASRTR